MRRSTPVFVVDPKLDHHIDPVDPNDVRVYPNPVQVDPHDVPGSIGPASVLSEQDHFLNLFQADLDARVNPEVFRNFSSKKLEEAHGLLMQLSLHERLRAEGLRISVVGSNGKGSTAYYIASLIESARSPVGLYTSPHLLSVTERIRLNLRPVSGRRLWESLNELRELLGERHGSFTYFEILTLLALYVFRKLNCPVQVYETGLGGRLDATRMARARVVVLTAVELEHQAILGDSLEAILVEKLGIITEEAALLIAMPQRGLTQERIRETAHRLNPGIRICFFDANPENVFRSYLEYNWNFARFCVRAMMELGLFGPGPGSPRVPGKAEALQDRDRPPSMFGRMEMRGLTVRTKNVPFLFDTAHNAPALEITLANITRRGDFPGPARTLLLLGMLRDRDLESIMKIVIDAGFLHVVQMTGDFLHAPLLGVRTAAADETGADIADILAAEEIDLVVMTGSHRIYQRYLDVFARFGI